MDRGLVTIARNSKLIFWDFDGVIKESVEIKGNAFLTLFCDSDAQVVKKIKKHHKDNGGVSRFDKIPLYMKWSQIEITDDAIEEYLSKFSSIVTTEVINSNWVNGFNKFKELIPDSVINILVTATPDDEINLILDRIMLKDFFDEVFGSPIRKHEIVAQSLADSRVHPNHTILIGDSYSDYEAAKVNNIKFFLRKTKLNSKLHRGFTKYTFYDFRYE